MNVCRSAPTTSITPSRKDVWPRAIQQPLALVLCIDFCIGIRAGLVAGRSNLHRLQRSGRKRAGPLALEDIFTSVVGVFLGGSSCFPEWFGAGLGRKRRRWHVVSSRTKSVNRVHPFVPHDRDACHTAIPQHQAPHKAVSTWVVWRPILYSPRAGKCEGMPAAVGHLYFVTRFFPHLLFLILDCNLAPSCLWQQAHYNADMEAGMVRWWNKLRLATGVGTQAEKGQC